MAGGESVAIFLLVEAARQALRKSYCLLYWFICPTISYVVAGRESVAIFLLVEAARQALRKSYCLLYWFICPTISYVVAGRESVAIFLLVEAARQPFAKATVCCIGFFVRFVVVMHSSVLSTLYARTFVQLIFILFIFPLVNFLVVSHSLAFSIGCVCTHTD